MQPSYYNLTDDYIQYIKFTGCYIRLVLTLFVFRVSARLAARDLKKLEDTKLEDTKLVDTSFFYIFLGDGS